MQFECDECGQAFTLAPAVLERYPGWTPRTCLACRDRKRGGSGGSGKRRRRTARTATAHSDLTLRQVIERFSDGPDDGVFTDGGARPNPGAGGWGAVWVRGGEIVEHRHGSASDTTNNRMELQALIEAFHLLPTGVATTIYSDSDLCVKTLNEWADGWKRKGWKRKGGPIKNLDLIQVLHGLARARPEVAVEWVPAHSGWVWNEYADSLASAIFRDEL